MSDFNGITGDALFLMQLNRFNDSRAFYEENKETIKRTMTVPMRQIAAALSGDMLNVDPMMNTVPTKMVSRVRRDTRYTRDKHLYRENMWIMFMRPKKEWRMYPCMWFEVTPRAWSCGVGTYEARADLMEAFRERLRNEPDRFREAVRQAENVGAVYDAELYRRPKPDCPAGLDKYYNAKYFYFIFESPELSALENDGIIEKLRQIYRSFAPMYEFLRDVSDDRLKTHQ